MRRIRAHTLNGCVDCADPRFVDGHDPPEIRASVGRGGVNARDDVLKIQNA